MKKNIKLNQKGIAHHLLIFALLALVVGGAGFAGYRVWKNKNIDAKAAVSSFPIIGTKSASGSYGQACRSASSTYATVYITNYPRSTSKDVLLAGTVKTYDGADSHSVDYKYFSLVRVSQKMVTVKSTKTSGLKVQFASSRGGVIGGGAILLSKLPVCG